MTAMLPLGMWIPILDGDDVARALFDEHYSRYVYADGRQPKLFVGPGQKLVLTTPCRRGLFVWRKFISGDGQEGINCSIFRNTSAVLSSDLVREADRIADERWPGERHFTYVNPRKIRSTNPGFCFQKAGWRICGVTNKRKLIILERPAFDRYWRIRTNLPERFGQRCRIVARGTMNSCLVEFQDGVRHVVSRFSVRCLARPGESE